MNDQLPVSVFVQAVYSHPARESSRSVCCGGLLPEGAVGGMRAAPATVAALGRAVVAGVGRYSGVGDGGGGGGGGMGGRVSAGGDECGRAGVGR